MSGPINDRLHKTCRLSTALTCPLDYEEFEQSYKKYNDYNRELSKLRNKTAA